MEAWQERLPLSSFKRGQWRRRRLFIIGGGAGKFLGVRRIFARILEICPKSLMCNFAYKFSLTKITKTLFGVTSKSGLHVFFCKPWVSFFEVKQRWAPFIPGFSWIFLRFSENSKLLEVRLHHLKPHLQHHCFT